MATTWIETHVHKPPISELRSSAKRLGLSPGETAAWMSVSGGTFDDANRALLDYRKKVGHDDPSNTFGKNPVPERGPGGEVTYPSGRIKPSLEPAPKPTEATQKIQPVGKPVKFAPKPTQKAAAKPTPKAATLTTSVVRKAASPPPKPAASKPVSQPIKKKPIPSAPTRRPVPRPAAPKVNIKPKRPASTTKVKPLSPVRRLRR